jgi:uncharacterized protein (TIGR03067 family)
MGLPRVETGARMILSLLPPRHRPSAAALPAYAWALARTVLLSFMLTACGSMPIAGPKLTGRWAPISAQLGGQIFPVVNFAGAKLELTRDSYKFGEDTGPYTIVPEPAPAKMDITIVKGPSAGHSVKAIWQLESENELLVCYQLGSGDRPATFQSPKGEPVLLVRYRRSR